VIRQRRIYVRGGQTSERKGTVPLKKYGKCLVDAQGKGRQNVVEGIDVQLGSKKVGGGSRARAGWF